MATKSYSKHKEYKEFSSSSKGTPGYTDEQFDMMKSELIPKGSKLESIARSGSGGGAREYHYEYKEEKHPSGKYDRKDLHTVEEYTIPPTKSPKTKENSSYYYEREERELPVVTGTRTYNYESSSSNTPGYSKIKSSKVTKDLSHNVDELDSLLDDLQKDQERQLYKSGYTSDTAESTSFDYRRGTPAKAPSSGYSTLRREEREEWRSPAPAPVVKQEVRQEMFREETHESRVVPAVVPPPSLPRAPLAAPVCTQCHHSSSNTLSRSSTPMNLVTTTVKTYTYEVPADVDPAAAPLPLVADSQRTYVNSSEKIRSSSNTLSPSPSLGCQYCSHCNTRLSHTNVTNVNNTHEYHTRHTATSDREHTNERILYPTPANEPKHLTPVNGQPNYGPTTYKYSETSYSKSSTRDRSPGPFPRSPSPAPPQQQPPKKLDDLLADFPEARFPTQPDGVSRRRVEVQTSSDSSKKSLPPSSRNVPGPAVYYPPGHTPFQNKPQTQMQAYQASASQGGGAYAAGRGMYEYESGAKSKEKHSEKKTAVPVCLPLCCAMPCVIM